MTWWLWLVVGAMIPIGTVFTYVWIVEAIGTRRGRQRRAAQAVRTEAELKMQQVVQSTIQQLFNEARRSGR